MSWRSIAYAKSPASTVLHGLRPRRPETPFFWHSTVDAIVQLEGGEEIGTFRQGNWIPRGEEGGWILVYASDDERRRLREAGYKFD